MNTFIFVLFGIIIVPLLILAVFLLKGKGGFLIAGYNTMSKAEQAKYDEKALCSYVGRLLILTSLCLLLIPFGIQLDSLYLMYGGIALSILVPIGAAIYMNTGDRFRKKDNIDLKDIIDRDNSETLSENAKTRKAPITIVTGIFTIVLLVIVGIMMLYSEKEPEVNVTDQGIEIKSIYGLSVHFADLSDIILIEESMKEIGVGRRVNGYGGVGDTLKGNFKSEKLGNTLLFVRANSSPTIVIERVGSKNIYISFRDGETTRRLYETLKKEYTLYLNSN